MMVLSASSVDGYVEHGNSYYSFLKRQLTWVVSALPVAFVASRLPHRLLRCSPGRRCSLAVVLLALTQTALGVEVNGNRNWLALGPVADPALRVRQAGDRSCGAPTSTPARSGCSATGSTR